MNQPTSRKVAFAGKQILFVAKFDFINYAETSSFEETTQQLKQLTK